ncbi:MAG: KH domain-containing protein [Clostridia bacterium]|nr:KH domain-containing protein [Clostridia bacterium]
MAKSVIAEGKTSTEAIENGLKILKVSKDRVEIKILENEDKRSFFSILTPRVVKVELTLKEGIEQKTAGNEEIKTKEKAKKVILSLEDKEIAKKNLNVFLEQFVQKIGENTNYEITSDEEYIYVTITGQNVGMLIGYRGETLNAMQILLTSVANRGLDKKAHIILDIEGYREKRKKALEELADKLARTVIKTGKQVILEPMSAYERKMIHNRLQDSQRVKTHSIGEEPYRKVVITKK